MWPWEHAAVGYLLFSFGCRAVGRRPPTGREVFALAGGSLAPDLVDKPLSWGLGWVPSGYAVGHSVFVALPVGAGLVVAFGHDERRWAAVAFLGAYWAHLAGDVLNPLRYGDAPAVGRVLWPVVASRPYEVDYGMERGVVYLQEFLAHLQTAGWSVLFGAAVLPLFTLAVWLLDGAPGLAAIRRRLARREGG